MIVTPSLAVQAGQLELHVLAQPAVEGRQRLVEQQQSRPVDERARERDPLPLASAQLGDRPARRSPGAARARAPRGQPPATSRRATDGASAAGTRCSRRRSCAGTARATGRRPRARARRRPLFMDDAADQDLAPSGSSSPATSRRTVVLPEPDGPRSVKNSPSRTSSETSTRRRLPERLRHRREFDHRRLRCSCVQVRGLRALSPFADRSRGSLTARMSPSRGAGWRPSGRHRLSVRRGLT